MLFNLIFVTNMAFLGSYIDLASCQHAIREIYAIQANPPGQRIPALEQVIDLNVKYQKAYLCVPINRRSATP